MSWFEKLLPARVRTKIVGKSDIPEGLWTKCQGCAAVLYRAELERNVLVCDKCHHHHRLGARKRIQSLLQPDNQQEIAKALKPVDSLKFKDSKKYKDRIHAAQKNTGENEALIVVHGYLDDSKLSSQATPIPLVLAVMDFSFMGGSMGAVVGEKFVRAIDYSLEQRCPFVCVSASGGARMQEGLGSLMQMAKTSAALARLAEKRLPYISILTDPTMGGVSASFAMLGDIILAEPNALIGFAGPRVIKQTVREDLPEGFQRSEFLLEHGHIDQIVDRRELRACLARLLTKLR